MEGIKAFGQPTSESENWRSWENQSDGFGWESRTLGRPEDLLLNCVVCAYLCVYSYIPTHVFPTCLCVRLYHWHVVIECLRSAQCHVLKIGALPPLEFLDGIE